MDVEKNIENINKRLREMDGEMHRLAGMLEVMNTLKAMGVKVVDPTTLKDTPTGEVIDEEPESVDE
tara:strand:+ start:2980 stop:3177 length:198 start_codon:yes stop_codon:yes gene_type:complete